MEISWFCITQILREIKFGDSRSANYAIVAHSWALNSNLSNVCNFWRLESTKNQNLECPKWRKMTFSERPGSQKLISRKIWVIAKSRNFHTVEEALDLIHISTNLSFIEYESMGFKLTFMDTLSENFKIFLSLRFYVKSILENLEVPKLPFLAILGALNLEVNISLQKVQKFI